MTTYENILAWIFGITDLLERVYVKLFKRFGIPVTALILIVQLCIMVESYSFDGVYGVLVTVLVYLTAAAVYKAIVNRMKLEQGRSRRRNAQ